MQIKKTVSQIALGLAVIGLAASTSAFTNKTDAQFRATRYWVNNGTQYVQQPSADPVSDCLEDNAQPICVLTSDDDSETIPTSFDQSERSSFSSLQDHPNASQGIYNP